VKVEEFKVGDLVFYQPSQDNIYADGQRQLGVIVKIKKDTNPMLYNFPESDILCYEYVVRWIQSGYTSTLMPFNLKKLELPIDNDQ